MNHTPSDARVTFENELNFKDVLIEELAVWMSMMKLGILRG